MPGSNSLNGYNLLTHKKVYFFPQVKCLIPTSSDDSIYEFSHRFINVHSGPCRDYKEKQNLQLQFNSGYLVFTLKVRNSANFSCKGLSIGIRDSPTFFKISLIPNDHEHGIVSNAASSDSVVPRSRLR